MNGIALVRVGLAWLAAVTGAATATTATAAVSPSVWVYPSPTGNLLYGADSDGGRLNDFSDCGYLGGTVALPDAVRLVPESRWIRLTPLGNGQDDTAMINAALYFASSWPVNSNGFRGVVFLGAGEYRLGDTLRLTNNGVVLKGAGSSLSSGTQLRATFSRPANFIEVTSPVAFNEVPNSETQLTEPLVPAGTRTFRVRRSAGFQLNDTIVIRRVATPGWLHATDMDILNNDSGLNGDWITPYEPTGEYERRITSVEGDWLTVDAPIPQTFQTIYGGGTVHRVTTEGRLRNCGVEDLACIYNFPTTDDDHHPNAAVLVWNASDVWMRNVVASGYISSCASLAAYSRHITVAECQLLNPYNAAFFNRYAFLLARNTTGALIRDCFSSNSRHDFVLAEIVPGPNAIVRCRTSSSDDDTGPHQRWSTGTLFDNLSVDGSGLWNSTDGQLNVQNRGRSGGGNNAHGWTGAYTVVWNSHADDGFRVRNPPTARNWLIGSEGTIRSSIHGCWYDDIWWDGDCWAVGADPDGTYDQSGPGAPRVELRSLYYAQRQQRLKWPDSRFREYRLGDIDHLAWSAGVDANVPLDTNWLGVIRTAFPNQPVRNSFDDITATAWRAFTIDFPLAPGERVTAASLTLGLRFVGGTSVTPGNELVFLDDLFPIRTFASLGWNVTSQGTSAHTLEVPVQWLQDGRLNVALGAHTAVDFATFNLQTTSVVTTDSIRAAAADTYVRDGDYENQNFGSEPELVVKNDGDGGFRRKSLLRWNLNGVTGTIADAKVRIFCNTAGQSGNEQIASVVRDNAWSESGLTWKQFESWPVDPPIAYWVPVPGQFAEFTVTPEVAAALGADRQFSLSLEAVQNWGDAGWVTYASREDPNSSRRPQLVLKMRNHAPTVIVPPPQTMTENSTLAPLTIQVGDIETPAGNLALTVTSSHATLFKGTNLVVGGSGANRTVTLRALPGQVGAATLTAAVSDGAQTTSASFLVNVWFTNSPPRISTIADQTMDQASSIDVPFTISDRLNLPGSLQVIARASNAALFPAGSLEVLTPGGLNKLTATRTLRLTPAPNRSGNASIIVSVSDGQFTATDSFNVTVVPVGTLPDGFGLSTPRDGAVLRARTPVRITAYLPPEGSFNRLSPSPASVTFLAGKKTLGTVTAPPYSLVWSNPPPGLIALQAYTTNRVGAFTSAPVNVTFTTNALPTPPVMAVMSRGQVAIIWPATAESYVLESTGDVGAAANWQLVNDPPKAGEGYWFIAPVASGQRRFFRLNAPR